MSARVGQVADMEDRTRRHPLRELLSTFDPQVRGVDSHPATQPESPRTVVSAEVRIRDATPIRELGRELRRGVGTRASSGLRKAGRGGLAKSSARTAIPDRECLSARRYCR
jgi:hypothetical protein